MIARFDELFGRSAGRDRRLVRLPALALLGERGLAIDTMEAVAAEVAAALRISQGLAASRLRYARALRERLPKVADIFHAGQIDCRMFQTIVSRTDLITDPDVLAAVHAELAHDEIVPSHCVPGGDQFAVASRSLPNAH